MHYDAPSCGCLLTEAARPLCMPCMRPPWPSTSQLQACIWLSLSAHAAGSHTGSRGSRSCGWSTNRCHQLLAAAVCRPAAPPGRIPRACGQPQPAVQAQPEECAGPHGEHTAVLQVALCTSDCCKGLTGWTSCLLTAWHAQCSAVVQPSLPAVQLVQQPAAAQSLAGSAAADSSGALSKSGLMQGPQSSTPHPLAGLLAHLQYPLHQLQASLTLPQAGRCSCFCGVGTLLCRQLCGCRCVLLVSHGTLVCQ